MGCAHPVHAPCSPHEHRSRCCGPGGGRPGRARPARRRGEADRRRPLHGRPRRAGSMVRRDRALHRGARAPAGHRPRPGLRLVAGGRRHRGGHPRARTWSPRSTSTSLPSSRTRSGTSPRRWRWSRHPTRRWPGRPARPSTRARSPCPPSSTRSASTEACKRFEIARGDLDGGLRGRRPRDRGRLPRRATRSRLYIEPQAMIAIPRPDGGIEVRGSMQCPYYVHTALHARAGPAGRPGRGHPGGDRRRASAARRTTRR